ncbi:MAG: PAS domain S-box protein, partial [Campylobacterota bacterium]
MGNTYQEAIENSNIVSKTDIDGIITFVNDEFCNISGYSKSELVGQNHNIVRHPDVPCLNFKELWETILNKKPYKATVKNLTKDKKTVYLNTTITPILDDNNEIKEFIAIRYDVTSEVKLKKSLEEEIRKNQEKQKILFWQSRMASLGQMLGNIAHQWRQPLSELTLVMFNMKAASLKNDEKKVNELYTQSKDIINSM